MICRKKKVKKNYNFNLFKSGVNHYISSLSSLSSFLTTSSFIQIIQLIHNPPLNNNPAPWRALEPKAKLIPETRGSYKHWQTITDFHLIRTQTLMLTCNCQHQLKTDMCRNKKTYNSNNLWEREIVKRSRFRNHKTVCKCPVVTVEPKVGHWANNNQLTGDQLLFMTFV